MLALVLASLGGCGGESPPPPVETGWETDFEPCAEVRETATFVPVTLLLTVDASGSMAEGGPPSQWEAATEAFTAFFQAPDAATLGAALRIWPDEEGCNDATCDAAACAVPQVGAGSLGDPAHRQALIDALQARIPEGGTPMSAALAGAATWAAEREAVVPDEQVAIVLVTDGQPNGCEEDIDAIAAIAADAAAAGTRVFAVGIEGSNEAQIDLLAEQGGTGRGYFVGSGAVEAELLSALLDIQGQVAECTLTVPGGQTLNLDLVRLEYTAGGEPVLVPRVSGAGACGEGGGWYLDGTVITLCPSSCDEVRALPGVALEVAVGCACEVDRDCPGGEVCAENRCVPCDGPGCGDDPGLAGGAVQGGALLCDTAPALGGPWLALAGLVAARRRRRTERSWKR